MLYDNLVSDAVLELVPAGVERIYVGKRRADHTLRQEEINALLVRLACAGKRVVRLKGGDPFAELQLPKAVIALKQGVGRLIRDRSDHGVLVICDPRMVNKPYGATFIKSLPAIPRTRELAMLFKMASSNTSSKRVSISDGFLMAGMGYSCLKGYFI